MEKVNKLSDLAVKLSQQGLSIRQAINIILAIKEWSDWDVKLR